MSRLAVLLLFLFGHSSLLAEDWKAGWITDSNAGNSANTWMAFRKTITLGTKPGRAIAKIAADSKYWLWINGNMVVFEGGLKRGPTPADTYYDEVDIAPWLRAGHNVIGVMVWYLGKDGFSHHSSGTAGLLFDCNAEGISLISDQSWQSLILDEYSTAAAPLPNYRLPEPSLHYDARKAKGRWYADTTISMNKAIELGFAGSAPWNKLVPRPIPLFKDYGLKEYPEKPMIRPGNTVDTLICALPYNAQVTPYLKIAAPADGFKITICTDNYLVYNGGDDYIRSEYITDKGIQEYESLGWINGHKVYYIIPKGVKVLSLKFRETGYDTNFAGAFACSDPFFNQLHAKALRTLYLNMRDSFMDCPDRERAQWTGDAVNQSGQAFYSLSISSHALAKKWLHEIIDWQKEDGVLFAPVPAGNWSRELPDQSLATVGYYGLWNYYLHTADIKTLEHAYEPVKKYLALWKPDGNGLVQFRGGDWVWGDWGDEKDTVLIFHCFYYMALKGMRNAASALDKQDETENYAVQMQVFKDEFNKRYWNGDSYRNPKYTGRTDDRVQALAVVSGLADRDKFPKLLAVFKAEEHASPYMEKYVMEALFQMGEPDYALERHKKRFSTMVNHPSFTTLWEGWNFNDPKYGGGTINHSWSGGALTVLPQYLCGIAPLEPGYRVFSIQPQPGKVKWAAATVASVAGQIKTSFTKDNNRLSITVVVPRSTSAIVSIPTRYKEVRVNDKKPSTAGKRKYRLLPYDGTGFKKYKIQEGGWTITALANE